MLYVPCPSLHAATQQKMSELVSIKLNVLFANIKNVSHTEPCDGIVLHQFVDFVVNGCLLQ